MARPLLVAFAATTLLCLATQSNAAPQTSFLTRVKGKGGLLSDGASTVADAPHRATNTGALDITTDDAESDSTDRRLMELSEMQELRDTVFPDWPEVEGRLRRESEQLPLAEAIRRLGSRWDHHRQDTNADLADVLTVLHHRAGMLQRQKNISTTDGAGPLASKNASVVAPSTTASRALLTSAGQDHRASVDKKKKDIDGGEEKHAANSSALAAGRLDRAMHFLNAEYKEIRQEMDAKLFECGMFKVEQTNELDQVNADLVGLAEGIGQDSASILASQASLDQETGAMEELEAVLDTKRRACQRTRAMFRSELDMIKEDLATSQIILDVGRKVCGADAGAAGAAANLMAIKSCETSDGTSEFLVDDPAMQSRLESLRTPEARLAAQEMLYQAAAASAEAGGEVSDHGAAEGDNDVPMLLTGKAAIGTVDSTARFSFDLPSRLEDEPGAQELPWDVSDPLGGGDEDAAGGGPGAVAALAQQEKQVPAKKPTKAATKPSAKAMDRFCSIGTKPICSALIDKLGDLQGKIRDALDAKSKELDTHNKECAEFDRLQTTQIQTCSEQIAVFNVELTKSTAAKQSKEMEKVAKNEEMQEVCKGMRQKFEECHEALKAKEAETCSILKIRQSTYQQLAKKQPEFQDCEVGPWIPGECTKTCWGADRTPGTMSYIRKIVAPKNKIGADCPPLSMLTSCGEVDCPVDCVLGPWSGWSGCTKECGGGSQSRTRETRVEAANGGKPCEEGSQGRQCNTGSCDVDCVLHEWTVWGTCSKGCRAHLKAVPGHQYRKRHVRQAVKGHGKCASPKSRERYEGQPCNAQLCPPTIRCAAPMDLVLVLDGSGSLYTSGPQAYRDVNYRREKAFAEAIIRNSETLPFDIGEQEEPGKGPGDLMRFGVIQFGSRVIPITPAVTGKKDEVLKQLAAATWPKGTTMTHLALQEGKLMFQYSPPNRARTMLLVTDGRSTDRSATFEMARAVRSAGILLKIVAVGRGIPPADLCEMASPPCSDNVETAQNWKKLLWRFNRFMVGVCPKVVPGTGPMEVPADPKLSR